MPWFTYTHAGAILMTYNNPCLTLYKEAVVLICACISKGCKRWVSWKPWCIPDEEYKIRLMEWNWCIFLVESLSSLWFCCGEALFMSQSKFKEQRDQQFLREWLYHCMGHNSYTVRVRIRVGLGSGLELIYEVYIPGQTCYFSYMSPT